VWRATSTKGWELKLPPASLRDVDLLREALRSEKTGSAGVDGVTWEDVWRSLRAVDGPPRRIHRGAYRAPRREESGSESDGKATTVGIAALEDKVVSTRGERFNQIEKRTSGFSYDSAWGADRKMR